MKTLDEVIQVIQEELDKGKETSHIFIDEANGPDETYITLPLKEYKVLQAKVDDAIEDSSEKMIKAMRLFAEVSGMNAENRQREISGYSPAFVYDDFLRVIEEYK